MEVELAPEEWDQLQGEVLATVPVLAGLVLPTRYRGDVGLALVGEDGDAAEAVGSAGAGVYPTTTPGGKSQIKLSEEASDMWPCAWSLAPPYRKRK